MTLFSRREFNRFLTIFICFYIRYHELEANDDTLSLIVVDGLSNIFIVVGGPGNIVILMGGPANVVIVVGGPANIVIVVGGRKQIVIVVGCSANIA